MYRQYMADLHDLGLSSYESQAYRVLLNVGVTSAQALAEDSDVPEGRIYDVLDSLEGRGFVRVQTDTRPKRFIAVEPEIAINRLIEKETNELQSEIGQHKQVRRELIEELPTPPRADNQFQTTVIGTEETTELLFERIAAADEQIVMVSDHFIPGTYSNDSEPDILDEFKAALERGVEISILGSQNFVETIPDDWMNRLSCEPFSTQGFTARATTHHFATFYLFDHTEVCFEIGNPMDKETVVGLIYLQDPSLAVEFENQLAGYWEEATPFDPQDL